VAHYVQYLVANKGLGMSSGKLAAQVAHAAVKGYELSLVEYITEPGMPVEIAEWNATGHTKIVLEATDAAHLIAFREFAKSRGINSWLVIDEGRTEVAPHSPTALGFPVLDKADRDVAHTFADLQTYRDTIKVTLELDR
jgi:peptidyl-tRNA hydrolase, PTH2 family